MDIVTLAASLALAKKAPGTAAYYAEQAQEAAASIEKSTADDVAYILGTGDEE